MKNPICISWMPSWINEQSLKPYTVKQQQTTFQKSAEEQQWYCMIPKRDSWEEIAKGLREAAANLREMPISNIVAAIDSVAQRWCNRDWPLRIAAREQVVEATGFSPEVVDKSFDVELRNYRADYLWRVLRRELGNPSVLDGFCRDKILGGHSFAIGPSITFANFTGNVPGLSALSIIRTLLVKSAVIAKVASGEPTFAANFVQSIFEVEPRLGNAIIVTYWERDDEHTLSSVLTYADAVIAYGGIEACQAIRRALRDDQIFVEHGHKISVGLISGKYLKKHGYSEIARKIAIDVSAFNQHACIAPQAYFIEIDFDTAREFGLMVAKAMDFYNKEVPLGRLSDRTAATLQMQRSINNWYRAGEPQYEQWQSNNLDWTVVLDPNLKLNGGNGNRFLRLVPISSLESVLKILNTYQYYLQNVGVGVMEDELADIARKLALLGASRICEPGHMSEPTMMWRHDGMMCIAKLLRWCDIEGEPRYI